MAVVNAAAALGVTGLANTILDAKAEAEEALDSGAALAKLRALQEFE